MSRTRDISNIYNSDDFSGENIVTIDSNYNALDKDTIFVNTASSAITVTLPASPSSGAKVKILDSASNATNNNITVNGNGNKIGGSTNNYVINVLDSIVSMIFINSSKGWFLENSYVPLDTPGKPTSASAVDIGTNRAYNNGAATITFVASDAGGLADYYEVVSSPGAISASGAFSPITVTGLQSNTQYSFAVRAVNAAGNSAYSTSSNTITATTVPQAPTINTTTAGVGLVTLTYTANGTGGKSITNFTATSNPSSITSSASASPITFTDTLTNGTSYTFTITATNANGTSAPSTQSSAVVPFTSIGGTITTTGGYRIHTFTGAGTFTYTGSTRDMEYLVVAGGGGGNNADGVAGSTGGGGGGGGYRTGTTSVATGSYNVVVGGGGGENTKGFDSSWNSIVSTGGGQGGGHNGGGSSGGSGGGGGGAWNNSTPGGSGNTPATSPSQGNNGGSGAGRDGGGGGGGGAGGTGSNGTSTLGGAGGIGLSTGITGTAVFYSGGGGGGGSWYNNNGGGAGGSGVGGSGANSGSSAASNTGGGGGGGYLGGAGSGGSGIVVVRYAI